jgi:hypothetical protein
MNPEIGLYKVEENFFSLMTKISLVYFDGVQAFEVWVKDYTFEEGSYYYLWNARLLCDVLGGEKIEEALFKKVSPFKDDIERFKLKKVNQKTGFFHPRIFRPSLRKGDFGSNIITSTTFNTSTRSQFDKIEILPINRQIFIKSLQQLNTLIGRAKSICNTVYPSPENFKTYGHEIRNLLLLACTEVETQMKGILLVNNYKKGDKPFNTNDYVKLKKVLKLEKYTVSLPYYPELGEISPFKDWDSKSSTKSLVWYDNYNAVKHDNENEFNKGDLISSINAISAIYILLLSQYGNTVPFWRDLTGNFFQIVNIPSWEFDEWYIPPFEGVDWQMEDLKI